MAERQLSAMWVKICANTTLEDAAKAAELGADAVGFVFAPSKRRVTAAQAALITPHLPNGLERIGVVDLQDAEEIAGLVRDAGLTGVQLHGGLDVTLLPALRRALGPEVQIVQTLHWVVGEEGSAERLAAEMRRVADTGLVDRVLIDSKVGQNGGGTGVTFDWAKARRVFAEAPPGLRLIVAGGLNPGNVGQAIDELQPWGVDVASGVEMLPGRKDPDLVRRFVEIAHGAKTP